MTSKQIVEKYPGEFNAGKYRAGRIHSDTTFRQRIRQQNMQRSFYSSIIY